MKTITQRKYGFSIVIPESVRDGYLENLPEFKMIDIENRLMYGEEFYGFKERYYPYIHPKNELYKLYRKFKEDGNCWKRIRIPSYRNYPTGTMGVGDSHVVKGKCHTRGKCYINCYKFLEYIKYADRKSRYRTTALIHVATLAKNTRPINKIIFNVKMEPTRRKHLEETLNELKNKLIKNSPSFMVRFLHMHGAT